VNRDLRRIALTTQLWIQIINDLIYRSLLELPLDFVASEHSIAELIKHVERAVKGPRAWSPTSDESPTPTKTIVLPVKIIRGYKGKTKVKLVNGGRQGGSGRSSRDLGQGGWVGRQARKKKYGPVGKWVGMAPNSFQMPSEGLRSKVPQG
jgi:hypothetical protein